MKTIIAGSRTVTNRDALERALSHAKDRGLDITEVVSGNARGVDRMGEAWARRNKINLRLFPADWEEYGKKAGYKRNRDMADYADALVCLWDGTSKGTKHMLDLAYRAGLVVMWYNHEGDFQGV